MLLPLLLISIFSSSWGEASHQHVREEVSKETLCPDSWIDAMSSGSGCLYFNSTADVTWEEAANWCQLYNASLLEIWLKLQLDFIRSELMFLQDNGVSRDWWTGGTDLGREGHWSWIGSLGPVADSIWYPGQPSGGTAENCLHLPVSYGFLGHDVGCSYDRAFICQRK